MAELQLRDFPPVDPVEAPSRFSQTLLRHFNLCNRAGYLYRKYSGGPPTHYLNRGTVAHIGLERMMRVMVEEGEREIPMDLAKDIMQSAIDTTPITVPAEEQARLRVMAAHFAEGFVVDPESVVGIEQKVVLPIEDLLVVGKLDVALKLPGDVLEVIDWKTAYAMTAHDEIAEKLRDGRLAPKSFQLLLYILLAAFGIPVETCPECEGTGWIAWFTADSDSRPLRVRPGELVEVRDPDGTRLSRDDCDRCDGTGDVPLQDEPLGAGANLFRAYEMYPQFLFDDGIGRRGPLDVRRPELIDHRMMLEGLLFKAAAAFGVMELPGIEPWKFEATPGTHCKQCPARGECPLPEHLRHWHGEINSHAEAEESAAWLKMHGDLVSAVQKELRLFASYHGPVRSGADEVWDFVEQETVKTDKEALVDGVERAVEFGEPFDLVQVQRRSTSNRFRRRKLLPEELAGADGAPDGELTASERWGDDAPWD